MATPTVDRLLVENLTRALETARTRAEDAEAARITAATAHRNADTAAQEANQAIDMYVAALNDLGIDADHI